METSSVRLPVPGHDADLEVVRHGTWGRPVLLFPSEGGSAHDAENNGMLDAVRYLVDAGRVKPLLRRLARRMVVVRLVDPDRGAGRRARDLHAWLVEVVLPWVIDRSAAAGADTVGVSASAHTTLCTSPSSAPTSRRWPSGSPATTT